MRKIAHYHPEIHRPLPPLFAWAESHYRPTVAPRLVGWTVDSGLRVSPIWQEVR